MPTPSQDKVFVHVVTFHHEHCIVPCVEAVLQQEGFSPDTLLVQVTDNNSSDSTESLLQSKFGDRIRVLENRQNKGFCEAHNDGFREGLRQGFDFIFILNPDVKLMPNALGELLHALKKNSHVGMACPKLLRANEHLEPLDPPVIDSAGMIITPSIRHFDRAAGEEDCGQYDRAQYVFGASGAAILMRNSFIRDIALPQEGEDSLQVFDEAFFAYREDADLSWRSAFAGWSCLYVPAAIGHHTRVVTPDRRKTLSQDINRYGVRNRFLLQLNNLTLRENFIHLPFMLFRNLIVLGAVLCIERSSQKGLIEALKLLPRALAHRRHILEKARLRGFPVRKWFSFQDQSSEALRDKPTDQPVRKVLILIINYNSGERLKNCLKSLVQSKIELHGSIELDIKIIDNASHDGSAKSIESKFQEHCSFDFSDTNLGFAGAINHGVKNSIVNSEAEALLILNPDTEVTADAIIKLSEALNQFSNLGAIAPTLINEDGTAQLGFTARRFPTLASTLVELFFLHRLWPKNPWTISAGYRESPLLDNALQGRTPLEGPFLFKNRPIEVQQPAGACLLIRMTAFKNLQGFDHSFYPAWFEDVDFCKRLKNNGWLCGILPEARVLHEGGYSTSLLSSREFTSIWYRNLRHYWKKHGSRAEFLFLLPFLFIAQGIRTLLKTWLPR